MRRYFLIAISVLPFLTLAQNPIATSDSIQNALKYYTAQYPTAQYRDIYKLFMQDFFGPGHILSNRDAARNYLERELSTFKTLEGPDYEPTGFQGNFYRVNLRLIADGTIPFDTFFDAFAESISAIQPPSGREWLSIWGLIDEQITSGGYKFANEDIDRAALAEQFKENNFIAHHSEGFNKTVNFHYRIISRDKFNTIIMPLLKLNDGLNN